MFFVSSYLLACYTLFDSNGRLLHGHPGALVSLLVTGAWSRCSTVICARNQCVSELYDIKTCEAQAVQRWIGGELEEGGVRMRSLIVLALTGLLANENTATGYTDEIRDVAWNQERPTSSGRGMAFTPAVTGSIVTPRARLKSQRDLHLPQSQQQRHAGWSAGRQQGSASPMSRSATLTRKHREHRPSQSHLNMDQEDSVPLAASRTTEGLQTNLRSSTLPISASYSQHFSAASQQGRGVPPVRHSLSIGSQYHHPLSDPFRGEFLIKTLSGTTSERHQVSGSDSALRKRMGTSEQNYVSKAAVNNQEMANSAYIHGRKDGSDPPQMEHGFGGNLLDVEPLQQSEVKTEPVVVATTPLVPAQKSSDPAERRDTTQVSPSKIIHIRTPHCAPSSRRQCCCYSGWCSRPALPTWPSLWRSKAPCSVSSRHS
ncbi:uncharacterized protein LOC123512322 [Portunus trituberculatus]|uniref:uncharacterized protein LOC123512322 n=1 Tax=Portunus trituberculatus TaxID=210409 RepID=UPI001E1CBE31|nr:uncharacterized protein LOC123512322 [Portunus trituberculatus]